MYLTPSAIYRCVVVSTLLVLWVPMGEVNNKNKNSLKIEDKTSKAFKMSPSTHKYVKCLRNSSLFYMRPMSQGTPEPVISCILY